MLGRYFPIQIGINADAATTANQLLNELKKQKIKLEVKNWTNQFLKDRSDFLINRDKIKYKITLFNPLVYLKSLEKFCQKTQQ